MLGQRRQQPLRWATPKRAVASAKTCARGMWRSHGSSLATTISMYSTVIQSKKQHYYFLKVINILLQQLLS